MATSPHQTATKPQGLKGRSFVVDGKELFKSLGKAIFHGTLQKWDEVTLDAIEAISAVGLTNEPPALAYVLIQKAATGAMFTIVGEARKTNLLSGAAYGAAVEDKLDDLLVEHPILINKEFFEKPIELPIVKGFQSLLERWLGLLGLEVHTVKTIAERFPSYFLYSLNEEWRKASSVYEPILKSLDTPFAQASDREWAWASYGALLQRRVDESLYDEAFSLRQIYVPLRAYYEDIDNRKPEHDGMGKRSKVRVIVNIKEELVSWLGKANPDDAVRVISGGPGSGKSSFAKVFAAELAITHKVKVLFIPLHLIDPSRELVGEVGRFVAADGILPYNPLDLAANESSLLIIFDGLDELANQGKAANETARLFAVEVSKLVNLRNANKVKLQVIISGRELIVQGNESEFRKPHQILTLLPYLIDKESVKRGGRLLDPHNILEKDQRNNWWLQYGRLTGKDYDGLPTPLSIASLQEITSQPLLNYLVALSYTREKLDFKKNVNLNQVYEDLVNAVYERAYERKRTHESIRNMKLPDFLRILEEIGLAAWHGDGRTTTVQEIARHCQESGLGKLLSDFKEGAEAGVIRLLAAFFFRQHDQNAKGDQTFEFTHKSFGEYLAAQRIVREMIKITTAREARARNADKGCSEREALVYWAQVTSANAVTEYIADFIGSELRLRDEKLVKRIQNCFAQLFSFLLANGMPVENLGGTFKELCFLARNSEESLLVCMSLTAKITKKISRIQHPDAYTFGTWLRRIQGQRKGGDRAEAILHLDYLDLRNLMLYMNDFYGAVLSHSNLSGSALSYGIFAHAMLDGTIMRGVEAGLCNFYGAFFYDTDLTLADFDEASIELARFDNVKLDRTVFTDENAFDSLREFINCDKTKVRYGVDMRVRVANEAIPQVAIEDSQIAEVAAENQLGRL